MATLPPVLDALAMSLADVADGIGEMSERELLDALRACEDLKARAAAVQARLTRRLDLMVGARQEEAGIAADLRGRDLAGLVAFARRESPARGRRQVGFARALTELPCTEAALARGTLSEWRAMLIARETACLDPQTRMVVDQRLCAPDPEGGSYPFEGWGDRRLIAEAQKLVAVLDPAAVVGRRSRAEADRHVSLRPAPDTMAWLSVLVPAAQGVAVYAVLSRDADAARAAGDPRSRGQVMVDTLVGRVTGQAGHGLAEQPAVPVSVNLTVSDQTLFGGGSEPGWLDGYGPILADHAVDLVRQAAEDAIASLRRLYASPETGALSAMDSTSRAFPKNLGLLLRLRDRVCRTPYCDSAIRHDDHVTAHAAGGETSAENGQGLCEYCNYAKQGPGWTAQVVGETSSRVHQVETTLPTGHRVRSRAPAAPRPSRHRDRRASPSAPRAIVLEIYRQLPSIEIDARRSA